MTGFIRRAIAGAREHCRSHVTPNCITVTDGGARPDVVGWHDAREIPNYWTYADRFVLQDHLFEGVRSWSLPAHLDMVSGWSASCRIPDDPMSCQTDLALPADVSGHGYRAHPEDPTPYAWTDLTYLLHAEGVSWRYFVANGSQPDCDDDGMFCPAVQQDSATPDIWNPLPGFETVRADGQLNDVQPASNYFIDAARWDAPGGDVDRAERTEQRAPARLDRRRAGMGHQDRERGDAGTRLEQHGDLPVLGRLGRVLRSRHPSRRERTGVRPARAGPRDQPLREGAATSTTRQLSTDSYLRFIEDDFLRGARLDPATDGRPDARPVVRGGRAGTRRPADTTSTSVRHRGHRCSCRCIPARTGLRARDVTADPLLP